jgi:hypothetical protein
MPRVIVTADHAGEQEPAVIYEEQVVASELESDHYASQLLERVGWGIADAEERERQYAGAR